MILGCC